MRETIFPARFDPNPYGKTYHLATAVRGDGRASALCYKRPRAINLRVCLWTTDPSAVTCRKCLRVMQEAVRLGQAPGVNLLGLPPARGDGL